MSHAPVKISVHLSIHLFVRLSVSNAFFSSPSCSETRNDTWLLTVTPIVDGAIGNAVGAVWRGKIIASPGRPIAF